MVSRLGLPILLVASTSFALPRPNTTVRVGANHHIGDASYVAKFGHAPDAKASERERMHAHLAFVRNWLASRPATRPELATRRAEILAYFDAYIAKYTTPKNAHVPWRTPVFIDDEGTICAVGYLIEQSVGRNLPEKIAASHRYDFIEDIARDMPEVKAWVEASGFTLEEIGSIQPAYAEPTVNTWRTWDLAKHPHDDGPFEWVTYKTATRGLFRKNQMEGSWTVTTEAAEPVVVGKGTMHHGAGMWTSFYPDGKTLGEGPYVGSRAHGAWKLYHPSGNLAAEGAFERGDRHGLWRFYYDTPAHTPIAIGRFAGSGKVSGRWRHFDHAGALLATSWSETPDLWGDTRWSIDGGEGFGLDIVAQPGEVKHQIHQGTVGQQQQKLDAFSLGSERIYVHHAFDREAIYDPTGFLLEHVDGVWRARDCGWTAARKAFARAGDLAPLHGLLYRDARRRTHASRIDMIGGGDGQVPDTGPSCHAAVAVSEARAKRLDTLLAANEAVNGLRPEEVREAVLDEAADEDPASADMPRLLAQNMSMYIEWPHIDGRFASLYETLAGRVRWLWVDGDPEREN